MNVVAVKKNQLGAVLSLELGILMAVVASIAIGFGIILGGKLPVFFDGIISQVWSATEVTYQSNEQAACNYVDYEAVDQQTNLLENKKGKVLSQSVSDINLYHTNYNNPLCEPINKVVETSTVVTVKK